MIVNHPSPHAIAYDEGAPSPDFTKAEKTGRNLSSSKASRCGLIMNLRVVLYLFLHKLITDVLNGVN